MIANFILVGLFFGALFMFNETADTNYLVCGAVLLASAYLRTGDEERHDKLVGALLDIERRREP